MISPHPYFSKRLENEFEIPSEKVLPFFKNEFKQCTSGKADLKREIAKYLPSWGWKGAVDELFREWFAGEHKVDENVLEVVGKLRAKGVLVFLASDNEKYRAEYVMKDMGLGGKFDGAFFSCALGLTKGEPGFYEKVLEKLNLKPEEVQYWDDDSENIAVAKSVGIDGRLFESVENFIKEAGE